MQYDLIVIGAGPGGYVAAIRAAQLGLKTAVAERAEVGGTCLNRGCIPTKTLMHSANLYREIGEAGKMGVNVTGAEADFKAMHARKAQVVEQLRGGVAQLLKSNGIDVLEGEAAFVSPESITVVGETYTARNFIIATGSKPAVPPIPGADLPNVVTSDEMLDTDSCDYNELVIIGGGVIGMELATAYSRFGAKVTVVEAMPKLLPMMDGELTAMLRKKMEASGVTILTEAKVQSVEAAPAGAKVQVEVGGKVESFEAEKVLVAVGRRTDTEALGLDKVGIAHDRGRITVNDKMETNVPNIYAIGDCLGKVMLAHVASAQGEVAAENALGEAAVYDGKTNPSCVYTDPEFAGVGLTEEKAKEEGIAYQVGKFPLMANGKALIMNGGEGMIKFIIGKEYGEVLGVHILGPRATDLIGECALAIGMEATVDEIYATIHAHPTVTEAVREAALAATKRAIHIPNK